jgi:fido (protein-threonine AMPylation protein)
MSGIAQFQLAHIDPFLDGNGRTSRLRSTLCLYWAGYDFKRLSTISEYYERDRAPFYRTIQGVRENNKDMIGWLDYFADGLNLRQFHDTICDIHLLPFPPNENTRNVNQCRKRKHGWIDFLI